MKFKVQLNPGEFREVVTGKARRIISDVIDDLKRLVIFSFGQVKSGKPGKFRQASAPGEAPAIQSGRLFRSLLTSFPSALTGELLVDTPYARFLEDGTKFLAPRPFIAPAIAGVLDRYDNGQLGKFN